MAADLKSALQSLRKTKNEPSPLSQNTPKINENIPNSSVNISHVWEEYEEDDEIFRDIDLFNFSSDSIVKDIDPSSNPSHLSSHTSNTNEYTGSRKRSLNYSTSTEKSKKLSYPNSQQATPTLINQLSHKSRTILNEATPISSTLPLTTPISRPLTMSVSHPLTTPISHPLTMPNSRLMDTPISYSMDTPIYRPLTTPTSCPITTPISRPLTTNISQPQVMSSRPLTTPISRPLTTPISRPLVTPTTLSQKFPGPAGCLPKLDNFDRLDATPLPSPIPATPSSTPIIKKISSVKSTVNCNEFTKTNSPWIKMINELDLTDPLSKSLLDVNIETIITKARRHQFSNGKVPHLRVLVKTLVPSTRSATAVLTDPSGDILATVHASVLEEYKTELVQGCAAILRQVSIFSPTSRKHYLNITLDNIVRLYPPSQSISKNNIINLSRIETEHDKEKENHYSSFNSQQNKDPITHHQPTIPPTSVSNTTSTVMSNIIEDDFDTFFDDVDVALLDL